MECRGIFAVYYALLMCTWNGIQSGYGTDYCVGDEDNSCQDDTNQVSYSRLVRCPHLVRHAPAVDFETQTWQNVSERQVIVFSAFLERRVKAGGPAVRIVASGLQEEYNEVGDLYCLLWYTGVTGDVDCTTLRADYVRIYPSTLHPDMWVSHFILCPMSYTGGDDQKTPYAVSVTPRPCDIPDNVLLVNNRAEVRKQSTHALCWPPVYMRFSDWRMVVEMLELHRILGVSEVTVYNQSMSEDVSRLLHGYGSRDDPTFRINVVQWHFPSMRIKNNVNCQRAAINDCVYRMSLRHQYVTVTDLDEVIVPRNASTWPEMMKTIATGTRGVYMFQHAYFRRNDTGVRPYLITQQSLWRTDKVVPEGKIRCKSMYNTDLILSLDLHFPYALVPGAEEYMLPPSVGMLHHYRMMPMTSFQQNPDLYTYIEDTYMHLYSNELIERVKNITTEMGLP